MQMKLPSNFELDRYGLHVRLVREEDAEFIVKLRTNSQNARFIGHTDNDVSKQIEWIREYKKREEDGTDYYFIFGADNELFGVCRIYNITQRSFTIGSWVFKSDAPKNAAIKASLITNEIAWNLFPDSVQYFDTRKENLAVVRYNKMLADIVREDEDTFYFETTKSLFEKRSSCLYRMVINSKNI